MRPAALVLHLAAWLALAPAATASPPPPIELHVREGHGWEPGPRFTVAWDNPPAAPPVAAVHYLVRYPDDDVATAPRRIDWPAENLGVTVPGGPGAYTVEVWLEDAAGAEGAPAATKLRFDNVRPGYSEPLPQPGWIGRSELPHPLRMSRPPTGSAPVSGVRGYAVSIDRNPQGSPCAADDRCSDEETDLRGGAERDTLLVEELPEGLLYVHSVAVSGSGMRSLSVGHAAIRVDKTDPETRISGVPDSWVDRPVTLTATATDGGSGMGLWPGAAAFTAIRIGGNAPVVSPGPSVQATVIEEGVHTVAFYARDVAGNADDGAMSNGRESKAPSTVPVRIDREPPAVVFIGSRRPADPELIEARVVDSLSGQAEDRGRIEVRAAGSTDPFEALPTVSGGGLLRARWRSDEYRAGEYEFRAVAFDRAGNAAAGTTRANGSAMVLPNPFKAGVELRAGLAAGGATAGGRTVRFGRGAPLSGRLVTSADPGLAGTPILIAERFEQGAATALRTTVVHTDDEGRFSLRLAPGPGREVSTLFAGTRTMTRAASRPLRLRVRSRVRLRASSPVARIGGRPVRFGGNIAAGPGEIPADGVAVELQFRVPGLPWAEFRTLRTDRRGRFRYRYRFSDDDSRGVRFRFRAVVPRQGDWPYEQGGSGPVAVRGI